MDLILLGEEEYEQDIRPLVKAFYPDVEFNIIRDGAVAEETVKSSKEYFLFVLNSHEYKIELCIGDFMESAGERFEDKNDDLYHNNDELPDRRMYRNYLHREMYRLMEKHTGKGLPWGTLTGIRPTKLALDRLFNGEKPVEIADHFRKEYLCSSEKTALCIRVANMEKSLLDGIDKQETYSLYVGVPFCPSICLYCSFSSFPLKQYEKYVEPYIEALCKEIDFASSCFPKKKLISIYFGGGTPTTLSADQLSRVIRKIKASFDLSCLKEWTVEAGRPDSITYDKLKVLKDEGISRISINPQTMQQKTLDLIGRKHTVEDILNVYKMARDLGFDNINTDLIIGLTGEKLEDVESTLEAIEPLAPENITVHALALKRAARLNAEMDKYRDLRSTQSVLMAKACENFMAKHGYGPYYMYRQKNMTENLENVGYSLPGHEGLYNILMMEEYHTILALGTNGSSKFVFPETDRIERVENVKSVKDYVERIDEMIERKREFLCRNTILCR
ncbi:MAG: coproporphyrinogen dehydrogenase HemZ [Lachnospiraceae bacterium]|nr:coproporphyrinogen dehydrogenase HemZ [Lachnospiraceae bacterium]